ncbi:SDR family NAD(P)-dependent oxidoreductase, partial [Nocardia sp. NPDC058497]|uniref:type I polyketide synthase n=1 Tax=Nocardia sp. NPDC058497 TaxID=3346529 RepID=UPI0036669EC4
MGSRLRDEHTTRLSRDGVLGITGDQGLAWFDTAIAHERAVVTAVRLDIATLREATAIPPLLHELVPPARRTVGRSAARADAKSALQRKVAGLSETEALAVVLDTVRVEVAAVLGFESGSDLGVDRNFRELGFDSLTAVEMRNRLRAVTGVRLPATLVFDYPTPEAVARFVLDESRGGSQVQVAAAAAPAAAALLSEDPVVIVGMGCRLPGGVSSPEGLWQLLIEERDAVSTFPTDRGWNTDVLFDPQPGVPGKSYVREGGFLHEAGWFDAGFFGISPREAVTMDPQQRVLLETVWEALEHAGVDPNSLRGSDTGVFTGVMHHDYPGNSSAGAIVSGRVSYVLGLEGPAVSVDTACSSSLVAVHQAVQALQSGECSMALAGGVTVMATPDVFVGFSQQRGLAADGRCKPFAEAADGTAWGEGAGVLVLERLSDARRLGHEVLAVVRGTAVNQDGASNGLTAPNGPSQQRVIRRTLANAGLSVTDIDVVEAHGTGTRLGDPIEAQALLATYGQDRPSGQPLLLGALKSNLGHTQAASGVAGVMKMVLAMRHGIVPKTLHVDAPSSHVDWDAGHVELVTDARAWPQSGRPRRAGVSSFGISGTNAHVIIEQAPGVRDESAESDVVIDDSSTVLPWVLSARSVPALHDYAARLAAHVEADAQVSLGDIGWSLVNRARHEHRAVVTGADRAQLLAGLSSLVSGHPNPALTSGSARAGKTAWVFPGQGSQWIGMGHELAQTFPVFAAAFDEVTALLEAELGRSVREVIWGVEDDSAALNSTLFAQTGLFAVGVATARLLESLGLTPDVVAGHSVGEIVAAHVAGVLSLQDAAVLVAARARLMQALPPGGAMAALAVREADVLAVLDTGLASVGIAVVNGARAVVVSGTHDQVATVVARLGVAADRVRWLLVSHAFHSPLMDPMLAQFAQELSTIEWREPSIPIVSNVTGTLADSSMRSTRYWVSHVRECVRFADGVQAMREWGASRFLIAGPDGGLTGLISDIVDTDDATGTAVVAVLGRKRPEAETLLTALATIDVTASGRAVSWERLWDTKPRRKAQLPSYAFQRRHYWLESELAGDAGVLGLEASSHPMIGAVVSMPESGGVIVSGRLALGSQRWLADHAVSDVVLLPGTGFVELVMRAGDEVGCALLEELTLIAPLVLPATAGVQVRVVVGATGQWGERPVSVHSRPESTGSEHDSLWTLHAEGIVAPADLAMTDRGDTAAEPEPWPPLGAHPVDLNRMYERLNDAGYTYGPTFQGLRAVWRRGSEVFVEAVLPEHGSVSGYGLHPALLDAVLQGSVAAQTSLDLDMVDSGGPRMPFEWRKVALHASGATVLRAHIVADAPESAGPSAVSIDARDETGRRIVTVSALTSRSMQVSGSVPGERLSGVEWISLEIPATTAPAPDFESFVTAGSVLAAAERRSDVPPVVVLDLRDFGIGRDTVHRMHAVTHEVLRAIQGWFKDSRFADSRLLVLTAGAVSVAGKPVTDVAAAAVWGLVRSAQSEEPGRILLADIDIDGSSGQDALADLVGRAVAAGEPQVAVRKGVVHGARLTRLSTIGAADSGSELDARLSTGSVVVTGGTGGLGALVARHLVLAHGARSLVLASRRGETAPGAQDLVAELTGLGARVSVVACDVSTRSGVETLLAGVPEDAPVVGVVHTAGVLDDGVVSALMPDRIDTVLAAKADAAWWLHEATRELDLALFVLYSSVAGVFGGAGQGNYAAANAFLDALAEYRRADGSAAVSIAWGLWDTGTGMGARLRGEDTTRLERDGIRGLTAEQGLAWFDAAVAQHRPTVTAARLDLAALGETATVPPLFREIAQRTDRKTVHVIETRSLAQRLRGLSTAQQETLLTEMITSAAVRILGYVDGDDIGSNLADAGFDSLTAIEMRNVLARETGLRLPAMVVFDEPDTLGLARYLLGRLPEEPRVANGVGSVPQTENANSGGGENDSIVALYHRALRSGRLSL